MPAVACFRIRGTESRGNGHVPRVKRRPRGDGLHGSLPWTALRIPGKLRSQLGALVLQTPTRGGKGPRASGLPYVQWAQHHSRCGRSTARPERSGFVKPPPGAWHVLVSTWFLSPLCLPSSVSGAFLPPRRAFRPYSYPGWRRVWTSPCVMLPAARVGGDRECHEARRSLQFGFPRAPG